MLLDLLGERHTFQTFDDSPQKRAELIYQGYGSAAELAPKLSRLNAAGAGVYFTVNETDGKGRKKENITRVRALFVDFDDYNPDRDFNYFLPPSCVVESSPGKHHVYWFVNDFHPDDFTEYQRKLSTALESDLTIIDLPRVMRVPGFTHQKREPFTVREIGGGAFSDGPVGGSKYTADELKTWIDSLDDLVDSAPAKRTDTHYVGMVETVHHATDEVNELIARLRSTEEGSRNDTLNVVAFTLYGLAKTGALDKGEATTLLLDAASDIGLPKAETRATLRSASSKAKPVFIDLDMLPRLEDDAPSLIGVSSTDSDGVQLIRADTIKPEAHSWLWGGWLARGKLHILAGSPGTGKTTICLSLAALVSSGGHWPDGTVCAPRNVVIWSGEDDPKDTLVPRLIQSNANLDNVYFVGGVSSDGKKRAFDPSKDLEDLHRKMYSLGRVGLLIVDPVVSAIAGDGHSNTEVRRGLQPLVNLAQMLRCALIGVTHLTKGSQGKDPLERINGSTAFGAFARVVFLAARDKESDTRSFLRAKSNIGPDKGGFKYSLEFGPLPDKYPGVSATHTKWGEAIDSEAWEVMDAADQTPEENDAQTEAKQFLVDFLGEGPRDTKSVKSESGRLGISFRTLSRAKRILRINSVKTDLGHWQWVMPTPPGAT